MGAYLDNRLHFMSAKGGWHVSFLEQYLKTSLPRRFVFQDEVKVLDLTRRRRRVCGGEPAESLGADGYKLEGFRWSVLIEQCRPQSDKLRSPARMLNC